MLYCSHIMSKLVFNMGYTFVVTPLLSSGNHGKIFLITPDRHRSNHNLPQATPLRSPCPGKQNLGCIFFGYNA
jgi:hypothetical protein